MIESNGQLEKGDIEKKISVEESMPCREGWLYNNPSDVSV
jgi:hypothetical protein